MAGTVSVGDRFRLTILAAERHPLNRADARPAFRAFEREYEAELERQGVVILFRGVPIDSPSVVEDLQLVTLPDGSIGWRRSIVYEVVSIDPFSPLLEHGPVPGSTELVAGPILLAIAVLVGVAIGVFGTVAATGVLEQVSTTAERVTEAAAKAIERAAPQLEGALVLGIAVAVLLILR